MKVAVLKERKEGETRVAATPDSVKRLIGLGLNVAVEAGAGKSASFRDEDYKAAGATIAAKPETALKGADIVLKVRRPVRLDESKTDELTALKKGTILIGMLEPHNEPGEVKAFADAGLTAFSLELLPRITRAQSMDVLSSQSNLAGYRAVIEAAYEYGRAFPMMMTAAGTVAPAKACILGAGVAGLQAIATARRLGAVVSAFDVRAAAKEQVESLGATFIEVPSEESGDAAGGYAKEMSEDYQRRQRELLHETLKKQDIVVTTALIPGKPAPTLITQAMVQDMKEGAIIVDLAAVAGGNCELTAPGKIVEKHGVKIVGHTNLPGRIAYEASQLYARNLVNFIALLVDKEKNLVINREDEIIQGTLLTHEGKVVHPGFVKQKA